MSLYGFRLIRCPLCQTMTAPDGPHWAPKLRRVCEGLTADEIERRDNPRRPEPVDHGPETTKPPPLDEGRDEL